MIRPDFSKIKNKSVRESVIAYVDNLEAQFKSPYFESFLTLKKIVDAGNSQVKDTEFDIFSDEGKVKLKKASEFSSKLSGLLSYMDDMRDKMGPKDLEELDVVIEKLSRGAKTGLAEKMAVKGAE
jgi:hypothetical protein